MHKICTSYLLVFVFKIKLDCSFSYINSGIFEICTAFHNIRPSCSCTLIFVACHVRSMLLQWENLYVSTWKQFCYGNTFIICRKVISKVQTKCPLKLDLGILVSTFWHWVIYIYIMQIFFGMSMLLNLMS